MDAAALCEKPTPPNTYQWYRATGTRGTQLLTFHARSENFPGGLPTQTGPPPATRSRQNDPSKRGGTRSEPPNGLCFPSQPDSLPRLRSPSACNLTGS